MMKWIGILKKLVDESLMKPWWFEYSRWVMMSDVGD